MKIKSIASFSLVKISHWIGPVTPVSYHQTIIRAIDCRQSSDYRYEFIIRTVIMLYTGLVAAFLALFIDRTDLYLMRLIHESFIFKLGFHPKFGKIMFSCHVLVIMFGLFIVYVRYKMPLSEKGEILIREVFTIYYNKGNIDSNGRGHLKDCDPVTLKRLKQIVQIGEFLMRFGPILYGVCVFVCKCIVFFLLTKCLISDRNCGHILFIGLDISREHPATI